MRLTSFTDYSLRVLIYLAAQPGRRATIAEIASAFDVSVNHLTKVVHFLGKSGWLANVRGKGGGLALAKPCEAIVIGHVVRQTEGAAVAAECFVAGGKHCAIVSICQLRSVLDEAIDAFYLVLDAHTLADLMHNREQLAHALSIGQAVPIRPIP